jgi:hypothetical protein
VDKTPNAALACSEGYKLTKLRRRQLVRDGARLSCKAIPGMIMNATTVTAS